VDDLFRFVLLRPAQPVAPENTVTIEASVELAGSLAAAQKERDPVAARQAVLEKARASATFVTDPDELVFGSAMRSLAQWIGDTLKPAADVGKKVNELTGLEPKELGQADRFKRDLARLDDTLVVLKLLSNASGTNTETLLLARRGYDVVQVAIDHKQKVAPRRFGMDDALLAPRLPAEKAPAPPPAHDGHRDGKDLAHRISRVDAAIEAVTHAIRTGLGDGAVAPRRAVAVPAAAGDVEHRVAAIERQLRTVLQEHAQDEHGNGDGSQPPVAEASPWVPAWRLQRAALAELPANVVETIRAVAGDPAETSALALSRRLIDERVSLVGEQAKLALDPRTIVTQIGSHWYSGLPLPITDPRDTLPTSHGDLHPVGVGDLLLVREHVKAYEGGEVAHIENVLRTEKLARDTRRLERTEQTVTVETEQQKEEERDTQSTDRFSLKRETENTIKTDAQVKAGLTVDAKYGLTVEVKADLQGSYEQQTQETTKQATDFSKDVVSRSVSKLIEKTRQEQTTRTIVEFEERYSHGFDNTAQGASNVSGVYQWVDKVSQAQVYNYGKRMLFDVVVPEPAAFYIWAQQRNTDQAQQLQRPIPLTVTPGQLDEGNYQVWAQAYGATGIDPPPPLHKTFVQAWDAVVAGDPHLFTKSGSLVIDDAYAAMWASANGAWNYPSGQTPFLRVFVGDLAIDLATGGPVQLESEEGNLAVGVFASHINGFTATLEVLCERTDRAWQVWQEKSYAAIEQAYMARLQEYQRALAEAETAQSVAITGQSPAANLALVAAELRKACISELTAQQFDAFGALETDTAGRPELNLFRTSQQGRYIRFFEQAFEWDHIAYFFFPYFWASKDTWAQRSLFDDSDDPIFADFLRAGAARVVFPVRPGFEKAVLHFVDTGLIWDGGDPPDISSNQYLPIATEVAEAEGRPGQEVAVGDPWNVHLPTTLVKLRPDDKLPKWKQVGDDWVPDE
jgi:hypothetical protein